MENVWRGWEVVAAAQARYDQERMSLRTRRLMPIVSEERGEDGLFQIRFVDVASLPKPELESKPEPGDRTRHVRMWKPRRV